MEVRFASVCSATCSLDRKARCSASIVPGFRLSFKVPKFGGTILSWNDRESRLENKINNQLGDHMMSVEISDPRDIAATS